MPVDSTIHAVGNTPVVKLQKVVPPQCADIYVKLEYFNPTGSYKDRMALAMVEEAEKRGELQPGMTVVEYTGGSTGSSLAFVCAAKGYPFHVVSSDAFAQEKLRTMEAFGARLEIVPSPDGLISKELIQALIDRAQEIASSDDTYFTDQFNNRDAEVGYSEIGREFGSAVCSKANRCILRWSRHGRHDDGRGVNSASANPNCGSRAGVLPRHHGRRAR